MRTIILPMILGVIVAEPSSFKLASEWSTANPSSSRRLDSYQIVDKINPLKVKIQVFDHRTAIDLFGSKAVKKFHMIQVRLFNNLREQSDLPSILIYSNSIELGIDLGKKYSKTNGSTCARENSKSNNIWERYTAMSYKNMF